MNTSQNQFLIKDIFLTPVKVEKNFIQIESDSSVKNQKQTNEVFSDKWEYVDAKEGTKTLEIFQKQWFLECYGFESEKELGDYLQDKRVIIDAGCGMGYKSAWFAELAPSSLVIGMDFSTASQIAAKNYKDIPNLFFIQGDIANTLIKKSSIDCVVCDQVIMHTEHPDQTFNHLSQLLTEKGEFLCYVYRKKALPRELVDNYFREEVHNLSKEQIWELSEQLTVLGKRLSDIHKKIDCPDIPLLGIKGGEYDIQRFIYWNFLKCFWKPDWSMELNITTNFDWYSPSNAKRYSKQEYLDLIKENDMNIIFFHEEEACYTTRLKK